MPGRNGRGHFDRSRYNPVPKYLSLKPRPMLFSPPVLKNNPFHLLGCNMEHGENFISIIPSPSDPSDTIDPNKSVPQSSHNGLNQNNVISTATCVKNPKASQEINSSTRNTFLQFYARQKKHKFGKNKKIQNKLKDYSHSLRAQQTKTATPLKSTSPNMSASDAHPDPNATSNLQDPAKQSFLQAYVKKQLLISKLLPPHDSSDMETDEIELTVPEEGHSLSTNEYTLAHMKSKLLLYYANQGYTDKADNIDTFDSVRILQEVYEAETVLTKAHETNQVSSQTKNQNDESNDPMAMQNNDASQRTLIHGNENDTSTKNLSNNNTCPNVGLFTSSVHQGPSPSPNMSPPAGTENQSVRVNRTLNKTYITCRFRIRVQQNMCHVPFIARQVVMQLQKTDPSMCILPFNEDDPDDKVLDSPSLLPDDEELLKTWVVNTYTYRENVNFSMKFSVLKSFKMIQNGLFPWMTKNNSFVKMDRIKSDKIVTVGFFTNFHPDYHNRDDFKAFCKKHVNDTVATPLNDDISVYARTVYAGTGIQKVTSRVCVIESATIDAEIISSAFAHPMPHQYGNVMFIPFTKLDDDYGPMLRQALLEQNEFLNSTKRMVVKGLSNITKYIATLDCDGTTPQQWIMQTKYSHENIILAVERNELNAVNVLYNEKHTDAVTQLFKGLYSALEGTFSPQVISTFYNGSAYAINKRTRAISANEKNYIEALKRRYANPQDASPQHVAPPPQRRKMMTYGQAIQTPQMNAHPDFAQTSTSNAYEDRIRALEDRLSSSNVTPSSPQDDNVPTSIQTLIETSVTKLGDTLRTEIDSKIKASNTSLATELMTQFQKMLNATLNTGSTGTPATITQDGAGKN